MDISESVNRANGGMHYADAVYRKHAPTPNYVRYIVRTLDQNLFGGDYALICYSRKNKMRINYKGEYLLLLSFGWVEGFRRMKASALEKYIIQELRQKNIEYDRTSYYFRTWILEENTLVVR